MGFVTHSQILYLVPTRAKWIPPTCEFEALFRPQSAEAKSASLDITSNDPDTPLLGAPAQGLGIAADPVPDPKANGIDDILFVAPQTPVDVTISLDAGGQAGVVMEWWIGLVYTHGLFRKLYPIYFGTLPPWDIPQSTLLNNPFPPGLLFFFFVLDDNPDGIFEISWMDCVVVAVTAGADSADMDVSSTTKALISNLGGTVGKWQHAHGKAPKTE